MSVVELAISDGRADITLNRPDVLNAVNVEMFEALGEVSASLADRDDVHVVVVSGAGRSFCSGIDVTSLGGVDVPLEEMIARAQSGFRGLAALPMPTVARVQGHALGAGLQVALACDIRVVAEDASLGLLEMRYGLVPDLGGSNRLPLLVGAGRAKKMIWLAERVSGVEAERIGLAEACVPAAELDAFLDDLVERLASPPLLAKRLAKRVIDNAHLVTHTEGMDAEAAAQMEAMSSPEFGEAVAAALQSRR